MPRIKLRTVKRERTKTMQEQYNEKVYRAVYDNPLWFRLRRDTFAKQPICECCKSKDIVTPTEDIHHIIPFSTAAFGTDRFYLLAFDPDNLIGLCRSCHTAVHSGKVHIFKSKLSGETIITDDREKNTD